MTVLTMEEHQNVSDHHELLEKIKDFCDSAGWTINLFNTNSQWANQGGGVYGFSAGSESYLEIESSGYGSQTLHFRFRMENSGSVADHEWLQVGAFKSGATGRDTANSTHPVQRASPGGVSNWNSKRFNSMKPGIMEKIWIFGNDKFVLVAIKLTSTYCNFISFGSPELFDTAEDEGNFCGYPNTSTSVAARWFNENQLPPFDFTDDIILYDGDEKPSSKCFCNVKFSSSNLPSGDRVDYSNLIVPNGYSTQRPLRKPDISITHDSDSLDRVLGQYPIYRIDMSDHQIGDVLSYSSKKFVVFPACKLEFSKGIAVRIA